MSRWPARSAHEPRRSTAPRGPRPRAADDDRRKRGSEGGPGSAVITRTKPQTKKPSLYRVLILNDDYTPMEFVVHVLERFFNKDREAATQGRRGHARQCGHHADQAADQEAQPLSRADSQR